MTPIHHAPYLAGEHKLPAGAVPLVTDKPGTVICQTTPHYWIRWHEGTGKIDQLPLAATQKAVVACLIAAFGGRKTMAAKLYMSERTIEAWSQGRIPLTCKAAHDIAHLLPPLPPPAGKA
jgi:hypothetical protein